MTTKLTRETLLEANLLEVISQSAIATDPDGMIFYWSDAAETLYGWTEDEVVEKNVLDIVPTQLSRRQAESIIMDLLRQDIPWFGEMRTAVQKSATVAAG